MGWPRTAFLRTAAIAGALTLLTGTTALAAPEFTGGITDHFEEVASTSDSPAAVSFAGMASAFISVEPTALLMSGTVALAYGMLVPKNA